MSLTVRLLFFCAIGIIAGLFVWPVAELIVYFQENMFTLFLYSIMLGGSVGVCLGLIIGCHEGLTSHNTRKIISGAITGLIIGAIGGVLGFIAGQAAGLLIGNAVFYSNASMKSIGYPLAKAIGWAALGIFLGIVEGVRSRSFTKMRSGIFGGLIGGFLGGLLFEYSLLFFAENVMFARLIGLVILGLFIGLFYGIIENRLARASLYVLNGIQKGKEILLTQSTVTLGGKDDADLDLSGYRGVANDHAVIKRKKKNILLIDQKSVAGTFVNDKRINEAALQDGDVVRLGDAQCLFKVK
ncbi:MAG: FHA domain-containing protein [Spirochaetales bacterium]|nr:FHA domain-containing protein [Spirochaetales bacterium]